MDRGRPHLSVPQTGNKRGAVQKRACGKPEGGIQGTKGFVKQVNATGSTSET